MNEEEKLAKCLYGEDKFLYHLKTEEQIDRLERFRTFILILLLLLLQRIVVKEPVFNGAAGKN